MSYDNVRDKLAAAWRQAGEELGIRVTAPFPFRHGVRSHACIAYLPDFGAANGMIVDAVLPPDYATNTLLIEDAQNAGYFTSFVSADGYADFDPAKFREALLDWGYYGSPDTCPP